MEEGEGWDKNTLQGLAESCYWLKLTTRYQKAEPLYASVNSSGFHTRVDILAETTLCDDNGSRNGDDGRLYSNLRACVDEISNSTRGGIPKLALVEDMVTTEAQFPEEDSGRQNLTFSASDLESVQKEDVHDMGEEEMISSSIDTLVKDPSPTAEEDEIKVYYTSEATQIESEIEEIFQVFPEDGSDSCVPENASHPSSLSEDIQVYIENIRALEENYILLKWFLSCSQAETLYQEHEASSLSTFQTSVEANVCDCSTDTSSPLIADTEETAVLLALETDYSLMKVALLNVPIELDSIVHDNDPDHPECVKDLLSEQIVDGQKSGVGLTTLTWESEDPLESISEPLAPDAIEVPVDAPVDAYGYASSQLSDLRDDASSCGSGGFFWTAEDEGAWETWSSDASVKSLDVPLPLGGVVDVTELREARKKIHGNLTDKEVQTKNYTIQVETQTEFSHADEMIQTENETMHEDVQTEGEIVQCCQCGVYSFLPLGEQFVIRLKEEMSQRLSLENLIRIVEKDAWNVRQELMDEREGVVRLQVEAADLKGKLTHAEHVSAELKTRNDELETSLEGARNMINRLEQQISNTSYFNSGIDYMLEAKLSQGRAVEALAKVKVLQNELLHSQSEVNKLLEQINALTKEKNEMVSNSVHQELLQLADERVNDAELRTLQLENEVFALKEENKQLQSLSSSAERTASLMSSTAPYKFMFNEQIDPYKEILALKEEMLHLKTKSLAYSSYPSLDSTYSPAYSAGGGDTLIAPADPVLPEVGLIGTSDPVQLERSINLSPEKFKGVPLIATGSDSEDSDWSDEDEEIVTPADVIANHSDMTSLQSVTFVEGDLYSGLASHAGDRFKPSLPPKPRVPPKPKPIAMSGTEAISHGVSTGMAFLMVSESEAGISFEEPPVDPQLGLIKKPRGPAGRQRPAKYSSVYRYTH